MLQSSSEGKTFLFIGTKRQASAVIAQQANSCNSYYVNHRWLGGMLTNWVTLKSRTERLKTLEQQEVDGVFNLLPKKEASLRLKELEKLRKHLNGIKNMSRLPDVAIIIDQKREMTAIQECRKLGIPIISILDTNCDPDDVDYIIPGNDDAIRAVRLITSKMADACIEGTQRYNEKQAAESDKADSKPAAPKRKEKVEASVADTDGPIVEVIKKKTTDSEGAASEATGE